MQVVLQIQTCYPINSIFISISIDMHQLNSILKKEIIWEMLSNLTYILIICSNLKKERLDHAVSSTYDIDSINANDCVLGYPSWSEMKHVFEFIQY